MEKLVNRIYYRPSNLSQLKGWQLQIDMSHCWSTYKNGLLYTSQGHNQCIRSSRSSYQCGFVSPRSFGVNCDGLRLAFHIQILVFAVLLLRNKKKAIYSLLFSNEWLNREAKQHNGSVSQSVCQLQVRWLGKAVANDGIYIQQCQKMPASVTSRLNLIAVTTPESFSKKIMTPARDLALLTNKLRSWKNWWKFVARIYFMHRSCKKKLITKE